MLYAYTWARVSIAEFASSLREGLRRQDGGVAAEYAILITLIALAIIIGAGALGVAINNRLNAASSVSPLGGS